MDEFEKWIEAHYRSMPTNRRELSEFAYKSGREQGMREAAEICTAIAKLSVGNTQADGSRNVYLYEQGIGAERCESVIRAAIGE